MNFGQPYCGDEIMQESLVSCGSKRTLYEVGKLWGRSFSECIAGCDVTPTG